MGYRSNDSGGRSFGRDRDSGGFRGSRRDSGRSFGGRGDRRPEMHDVTCDKCGKECQVPFRPTGDKPVLCSDCFRKDGGASRSSDRSFGSRDNNQSSSAGMSQDQFKQLNSKLDKILEILSMIEFEDEEEGDEDSEDDEESEEEVVEEK